MSDTLERVLLTNVPDFVDGWVLKSTIPCGGLIQRVEINPLNSSKMMILTKGQYNAQKIARTLDNYIFCGSVIRARYIFVKPPEGPQAATSSITIERTPGAIEKTSDEDTFDGHCNNNNLQTPPTTNSQPAKTENGQLRQDRKRRSSATANYVETPKDARREESAVRGSKTASRGPSRSLNFQDSLPERKQSKDSWSQESRSCRFCLQSGHATWSCEERAEYYKVGRTTKGINPPGYDWPESSIVKIEGLYAGPVIEYIEKNRLQMYRMNREQIRIMFAWLTNYMICHDCGAAGHKSSERLCKYLPVDPPVTDKMIGQLRKPFCRRMKGMRDKLPFGKLQQQARRANQQFSERMGIQDGVVKYYGKREGKESEKPQRGTSAEPTDDIGELGPPEDPLSMLSGAKRIKIAQPDDFEQYTDDEEDGDEDDDDHDEDDEEEALL